MTGPEDGTHMTPHAASLVVSDLGVRVHTTDQPLTERCGFADGGEPPCLMQGDQRPAIRCRDCNGSGRVPVGVGDTVTLVENVKAHDAVREGLDLIKAGSVVTGAALEAIARRARSLSVRVEWVGPPARVYRSIIPPSDFALLDQGNGWYPRAEPSAVWIRRDLYDDLGIADLPDTATVYLFGETT